MITIEQFEKYYMPVTESGCWIWIKYCMPYGHGQLRIGGKTYLAHRVSYELFRGPIPEGLCVCHKCDVPQCVNPDHLFLGTQQENIMDRVKKGRPGNKGKLGINQGIGNGSAKLTEKIVKEIFLDKKHQQSELAYKFNISQPTVSDIKTGRCWKWFTKTLLEELQT